MASRSRRVLRAAIDAGPLLDPPTGIARYTRQLADAIELHGIEVVRYAVALGGRAEAGIRRRRIPARAMQWSWRRFGGPPIDRLVGEVDVVHATNFVLPVSRRAAGVVTVHDLSFLRDDLWPGGERLRSLVPWSVQRAGAVLVPTRAVAQELASALGVDEAKIHVTYEGVAPLFFGATPLADTALAAMGIRAPFMLAVGALAPRKNLARLVRAWKAVAPDLRDWMLVLAGPRGWGPELPRAENVVLTGWLGDETLPGLMAAADVFCFPSLYEGFGLPPLEAMAAGTACVVGRYPAAEEVVGEGAWIVDPRDAEGIADALRTLARDEPRRLALALAGRARAAGFTWDRAARATIEAYEAAIG